MQKMMKIKLVHSATGCIPRHRKTVRGLGFNRLYEEREIADTPQSRGMVKAVCHLVEIIGEDSKRA